MNAFLRSMMDVRTARFSYDPRPFRVWLSRGVFMAAVFVGVLGLSALAQEGMLQTIREDVRGSTPPSPAPPPPPDCSADNTPDESCDYFGWTDYPYGDCGQNGTRGEVSAEGTNDGSVYLGCLMGVGAIATSPIWVPHALLGDDFRDPGVFFHNFPYDGAPCYASAIDGKSRTRPFAVRLGIDYLDTFDRLDSISGRLLVETTSRFGLDASWNHFEETLRDGGRDQLELGDFNLVYRFAQSDWAEFRAGLGMNWLGDASDANVGFNFTYGADFYPRKPWVLSSTIDCGTLGETQLFRFRTTAGVVFHGVESYAGYEYTDIGRTHWNGLVAGLQFWF